MQSGEGQATTFLVRSLECLLFAMAPGSQGWLMVGSRPALQAEYWAPTTKLKVAGKLAVKSWMIGAAAIA